MADYQTLAKVTNEAGWAGLLWSLAVVLFLTSMCASYVFRDCLERASRVPPRRRPPILTPPSPVLRHATGAQY